MGVCTVHSCSDCGILIPHEIVVEYQKNQGKAPKKVKNSVPSDTGKTADATVINEDLVQVKIEEPEHNWIKKEKIDNKPEISPVVVDKKNDEDKDEKKFGVGKIYNPFPEGSEAYINFERACIFGEPVMKRRKKEPKETKETVCNLCDKQFSSNRYMLAHIERVHRGVKYDRVSCVLCGVNCTTKDIYPHYRLHGTTRSQVEKDNPDLNDDLDDEDEEGIKFDPNDDGHISESEIKENNESIDRCEICNKAFKNKKLKKRHAMNIHESIINSLYSCVVCKKDVLGKHLTKHFKSHGAFESEIIREEGMEPQLNIDRLSEFKKNSLNSFRSLYENKPKQCVECGQLFSTQDNLKKHIRKMHTEAAPKTQEKVPCHLCGKEYAKESLLRHIKYVHEKFKGLACGTCFKPFGMKLDLHKHMIDVNHMNEAVVTCDGSTNNPFACSLCQYAFTSMSCWHYHSSKVHKGAAKPRCGYCGLIHESLSFIKYHLINIHAMKDDNEECGTCQKQSDGCHSGKQQNSFFKFEMPRPKFACGTCEKPFLSKERLQRHLNQGKHRGIRFLHEESGVNAFACLFCIKSFVTYDCWYKHANDEHNNIYETKCGFCRKHFSNSSIKMHLISSHLFQGANDLCADCLDGNGCKRERAQEKHKYNE